MTEQSEQPMESQAEKRRAEPAKAPDAQLVKVAAVFLVLYVLLYVGLQKLVAVGAVAPLLGATATVLGACSRATGLSATTVGTDIYLATRTLRIDLGCTALPLMIVYTALVLAYPLPWRRKAIGLLVGLPVLAIANFVRLVAVAQLSGRLGQDAFLFVHDYMFQIGMVGVVIALWGGYLWEAGRRAANS